MQKTLLFAILKYVLLVLLFFKLYHFIQIHKIEKQEEINSLINMLITTIGIVVAIIITFLFAKMYSDRTEKIERKRQIDRLTKKITALRKFFYHILNASDFWKLNETTNVKNIIEKDYPNYSWKDFNKLNYTEKQSLRNKLNFDLTIFETYIAIRDLIEGKLNDNVFNDLYKTNYSLIELDKLNNLFSRIYVYFEGFDGSSSVPDIASIHYPFKNNMLTNLKSAGINLKSESAITNSEILNILNYYPERIIVEAYPLIKKNMRKLSLTFKCLLGDLIILVFVLISCVLYSSVKIDTINKFQECLNISLISFFVSIFLLIVFDILINVFVSIVTELKIEEFYE
jgi:Co/Zn/Cd efflux system component